MLYCYGAIGFSCIQPAASSLWIGVLGAGMNYKDGKLPGRIQNCNLLIELFVSLALNFHYFCKEKFCIVMKR